MGVSGGRATFKPWELGQVVAEQATIPSAGELRKATKVHRVNMGFTSYNALQGEYVPAPVNALAAPITARRAMKDLVKAIVVNKFCCW